MSEKLLPVWDEFILWLAAPSHERGLVTTEEEWAKAHGYNDARQLRRWKKTEAFIARQAELNAAAPTRTSSINLDDLEDDYTGEEQDYRLVKAQLLSSAKTGNLKATELFMKLYGKTWIEEEQASRSSDFSNLDTEALVAKVAVALAPELLAGALVTAGWSVSPPVEPEQAG